MAEWTEFRAVYRRPPSYLDGEAAIARGYVECRTQPQGSITEARRAAMHRSEETLAWIVGYEVRTVTATEWRPDAEE